MTTFLVSEEVPMPDACAAPLEAIRKFSKADRPHRGGAKPAMTEGIDRFDRNTV
jgi:hypothetical protein